MKVTPDDEVFRTKLVFLGPAGYSLPVHLTYAQYGLFAVTFFPLLILGRAVFDTFKVTGPVLAIALLIVGIVSRHMDADRPARKVIKAFAADVRPLHGTTTEAPVKRFTTSHITVRHEITGGDNGTRPALTAYANDGGTR